MRTTAAIILLAIASAVSGQVRGPAEVVVPVGRLASIPIVLDADESDYVILGANVDGLREYDPDPRKLRLRVIGYEAGIAYVVVSSQKAGKLQAVYVCKVIVGTGPGPVPPVPPNPDPPKPDPPTPVAGKLFVVVIEETRQAVPDRAVWFADRKLEAAMKAKGHKWRIVDKDVTNGEGQTPPDVKRFIEAAAGKTLPMLFLVSEAGKTVHSGPVPKTGDEMIALLAKWGG